MREIKFRGKSLDSGEWYYGNLYDKDTAGRTHIGTAKKGCLNIDPETVGQYTGLKDKNGVEIYEGDMLASGKARHLVEYQEKEGAFMGVNPNYGKDMLSGEDFSTPLHQGWITRFEKEVIGNIHDNPELLK